MSDLLRPTAGLWNLVIRGTPQIRFGDWQIQPIDETLQNITKSYLNLPVFPPDKFNLPTHIAIGAASEGKTDSGIAEIIRAQFLSTMRFCRDGNIIAGEFWWTDPNAQVWSPWDSLHITNLPNPETYEIGVEDIPSLEAVHQIVAHGDLSHGWLAAAITRFHDSYTRAKEEDAYVDLVIALEALCGDRGGDGNLKYKVALRAAHLIAEFKPMIADHPGEKKDVFELAKQAYDARSNLVHGGKRKGKAPPIKSLRSIVRHVLLAAIQAIQEPMLAQTKYDNLAEFIDQEFLLK